jgi:hypothetical protein
MVDRKLNLFLVLLSGTGDPPTFLAEMVGLTILLMLEVESLAKDH